MCLGTRGAAMGYAGLVVLDGAIPPQVSSGGRRAGRVGQECTTIREAFERANENELKTSETMNCRRSCAVSSKIELFSGP